MQKLLTSVVTAVFGLTIFALMSPMGCGSSTGPRIEAGLNTRNLCGYAVSGMREETRCINDSACTQADEFCWQSHPDGATACTADDQCANTELCFSGYCYPACEADSDCSDNLKCLDSGHTGDSCAVSDDCPAGWTCETGHCLAKTCRVYGYCRQCDHDGQCQTGICDNGWCRANCSADSECDAGLLCTGGVCRPPHSTDFSFCNAGDRDLEINASQTVVKGDADAVPFCDIEWDSSEDTIVVAPDDCAMLRVRFRPPEEGTFRARIDVFSNDDTLNPYSLFMCGYAVSNECSIAYDGTCPDCPSCGEDDFKGYEDKTSACGN